MQNTQKTHYVIPNHDLVDALTADEQAEFHSLLRKIERNRKLTDAESRPSIVIDSEMPEYDAVAHAIASREKGQKQLLNDEVDFMAVEREIAFNRGVEHARYGIQYLCPPTGGEKVFARIEWRVLPKNDARGLPSLDTWVLCSDQTGTVLEELLQLQAESKSVK